METIGCALTSLAASILVYRQTGGSALSVALMLIASAAPSLLMGLVAGVFVDRYDRRRIMITADVLRAALVLLIPFLAPYSIAWLYVIVLVTSAIGQFFDPAWESVLPEAAPDEELAVANSLMAISTFGSTAIGFAASGLIASSTSIDYAFYLNPFAYFFSAACIFFISVEKVGIAERTSVAVAVRNLRFGIERLFETPVLRSLLFLCMPVALSFGLINSLLLPFATRALDATEFEYRLQEGLTSVGFVVSSVLMAAVLERWREGQWVVVGLVGMGLVGLGYSRLESVGDVFGGVNTFIALYDRDTNSLRFPYWVADEGERIKPPPEELGEGLLSVVIETGQPLVLGTQEEQVARGAAPADEDGARRPQSWMAAPVLVGEAVTGVVCVQDDTEHRHGESDVRLLSTIRSSMGVALEKVRLFDETARLLDETQQRNAELAVINSVQQGLVAEMDMQAI